MVRVLAIDFFANSAARLNALRRLDWCDAYYLPPDELVGGRVGGISALRGLGIDFGRYDAALIFNDGLSRTQEYFLRQCARRGITVYANQHGFNKSILQIVDSTPNLYSKYWNCFGRYWLDRYAQVMKKEPLQARWISLGSLTHDYLHDSFSWDGPSSNGKVLLVHEPDTGLCEEDKLPLMPDELTKFLIGRLRSLGVPFDMKVHPNWANFVGNTGKKLWKPEGVSLVNIAVEDIRRYSLVLGMRSSVLLDAAAMNVPTLALRMDSPAPDDHFGPVDMGLIPVCDRDDFDRRLSDCFNKAPSYDMEKLKYFLGDLGRVARDYHDFLVEDLRDPAARLGERHHAWSARLAGRMKENWVWRRMKEKAARLLFRGS